MVFYRPNCWRSCCDHNFSGYWDFTPKTPTSENNAPVIMLDNKTPSQISTGIATPSLRDISNISGISSILNGANNILTQGECFTMQAGLQIVNR